MIIDEDCSTTDRKKTLEIEVTAASVGKEKKSMKSLKCSDYVVRTANIFTKKQHPQKHRQKNRKVV